MTMRILGQKSLSISLYFSKVGNVSATNQKQIDIMSVNTPKTIFPMCVAMKPPASLRCDPLRTAKGVDPTDPKAENLFDVAEFFQDFTVYLDLIVHEGFKFRRSDVFRPELEHVLLFDIFIKRVLDRFGEHGAKGFYLRF